MEDKQAKKVGTGSYLVAGLGFIPGIGILFAIIAIILGFVKRRYGGKQLVILGCSGIAFSALIYGTIYYLAFVVRGGVYDELRGKLAESAITNLVKSIEYFKVTKGRYPNSLLELKDSLEARSLTFVYDTTVTTNFGSKAMPTFVYQLTEDKLHYHLLGVGLDQMPFT
jgi:hypothetical protein